MKDFLRCVLEFSVFLPAMLLAYLPVKQHLRVRPLGLAAAAVSFSVLLCLTCGFISFRFRLKPLWLFGPAALSGILFYLCTLNVSCWKSVSIYLAICAVFSCLYSASKAVHYYFYPDSNDLWLSLEVALVYNLLCWIFALSACYPASHAARSLVNDDSFARTWYLFWILPILFIGMNLFMMPVHPEVLQVGRILEIYIVFSVILLLLLLLFYFMFYRMAASLNRNDRLRQENLFLSMQQAQYNSLRTAISETREARHDMHHHLNALQALAERGDWEALTDYLSKTKAAVPDTALNLCDNMAVDAVASHYAAHYKKYGIPFSVEFDLPVSLPVPEIDFCLVLSNLLENALEASLRIEQSKRHIRVQARLHSSHIVILTVKNAFDGAILMKDGNLLSSKRTGTGIGTQSVRRIAEKNGGSCRFSNTDGVFCANVMLRGGKVQKAE